MKRELVYAVQDTIIHGGRIGRSPLVDRSDRPSKLRKPRVSPHKWLAGATAEQTALSRQRPGLQGLHQTRSTTPGPGQLFRMVGGTAVVEGYQRSARAGPVVVCTILACGCEAPGRAHAELGERRSLAVWSPPTCEVAVTIRGRLRRGVTAVCDRSRGEPGPLGDAEPCIFGQQTRLSRDTSSLVHPCPPCPPFGFPFASEYESSPPPEASSSPLFGGIAVGPVHRRLARSPFVHPITRQSAPPLAIRPPLTRRFSRTCVAPYT